MARLGQHARRSCRRCLRYEVSLEFSKIAVVDNILGQYRDEWADFVKGIQSVFREVYFDYNKEQVRRSVVMIKNYIEGNMLEIEWFDKTGDVNNNDLSNEDEKEEKKINMKNELKNKEELPDWKTYMAARLGSVGGQMSLQLLEYAKNIQLTDAEFGHPLMVRLEQAVSEEMTLVNDYLTFRKEVAENDFMFSKMRHAFPVLVNEGNSNNYDF